jgi:hypothetical protein
VPHRARAFVADLGRATPSIRSSLRFRQGQAPKGNRNAFKRGRYSAEAIASRREMAKLIRAMRIGAPRACLTVPPHERQQPDCCSTELVMVLLDELGRDTAMLAKLFGVSAPPSAGQPPVELLPA